MIQERVERVQTRKDFLLKDADSKIAKLRKLIDQCKLEADERTEENNKLLNKIAELTNQVEEREKVYKSRKESQGVQGDPTARSMMRMKKVVARRQLIDTARVQAEEIDFLRQELDRMRQKTFPSFVRATKQRLATNPDER